MIIGMIINSQIAYLLNSYWSGKFVGYSTKEQALDILPSFLFAISMGLAVFLLGSFLPLAEVWTLVIQIVFGAIFVFVFGELFKFNEYMYIKSLVLEQLTKLNSRNAT